MVATSWEHSFLLLLILIHSWKLQLLNNIAEMIQNLNLWKNKDFYLAAKEPSYGIYPVQISVIRLLTILSLKEWQKS